MPQKACERGIYHVMAYAFFFSKCPKIEDVHFRFIFCFQNQKGKMGHFKKNEYRKVGHFEKKARDQLKFSHLILKTENGPKMSIFDFGAFRKKIHMQSRATYIFHILFGVFQVTPPPVIGY